LLNRSIYLSIHIERWQSALLQNATIIDNKATLGAGSIGWNGAPPQANSICDGCTYQGNDAPYQTEQGFGSVPASLRFGANSCPVYVTIHPPFEMSTE